MKWTFTLQAFSALVLSGCNLLHKQDKIESFMPGMYATEWKNEFTQAKDTIMIAQPFGEESATYNITKRSYYQQTIDGKVMKPHYKVQSWTGTYDRKNKSIMIDQTGRVFSFTPDRNILVEGTTAYAKIK